MPRAWRAEVAAALKPPVPQIAAWELTLNQHFLATMTPHRPLNLALQVAA
jgi:hypothetical protein